MVIHRSDLHGIFLDASRRAGVELLTDQAAVHFQNSDRGARVSFQDGHVEEAGVVIAADGLHSVARKLLVDDQPVSSAYVAYRGAMPIEQVRDNDISEKDVVLYSDRSATSCSTRCAAGRCSTRSRSSSRRQPSRVDDDWGTPDELDAAFEGTCSQVREGIPLMWRDRWWRMFDRDPIMNWVHGRIAVLGDAAHPPLQYMAQGAIMAIEDGWVLAEHVGRQVAAGVDVADLDWDDALSAYNAVRPEHCRRVLSTGRAWGELWHLDGLKRLQRNAILRARDTYDHTFTEWIYGNTALFPEDEPAMYPVIPLDSVEAADEAGDRRELVTAE